MDKYQTTIFESVRFIGDFSFIEAYENSKAIKNCSDAEFLKAIDQLQSLCEKFYIMIEKEIPNHPADKFDDYRYKTFFKHGKPVSLSYGYHISEKDTEVTDKEFCKLMMNKFQQFAKSNGFNIHHDIAQDTTYATDSSKYPDMLMALIIYEYYDHKDTHKDIYRADIAIGSTFTWIKK